MIQVLALDTCFGSVLVPVSMVAQIVNRSGMVPFDHPSSFIESGVKWQGITAPVVRSSEMLGADHGTDRSFSRAVVLWPLEGTEARDLFALSSLGSPNVFEFDKNLKSVDSNTPDDKYVLQAVSGVSEVDVIVDLKQLSFDIFRSQ